MLREGTTEHTTEAGRTYARALATLMPLWQGQPYLPRRLAKRIAIRLLETSGQTEGSLIGLLLARAHHASIAEHSLKTAILTAALVRYLGFPRDQQLDATTAALLHHLGHEIRGSFSSSIDAGAQRGLMALLLTPHTSWSHLRQVLAAFQHELRFDGEGEPRLDFPVRQHPLSHLIKLTSDFAEFVSKPTQVGNKPREPMHPAQALRKVMDGSGKAYHPGLAHALSRVVGPAPVGTVVELSDKRLVVIVSYASSDSAWTASARAFDEPSVLVQLREGSEPTIVGHRSMVEAWKYVDDSVPLIA